VCIKSYVLLMKLISKYIYIYIFCCCCFRMKYGKEYYERASGNVKGCVNERVVHKLSVQPPTAYLIQQYLIKIAEE
jgi:hypothetical protein